MRARLLALTAATAMAVGSALLGANPAMAATKPTLTGPVSVTGWTWATMTGTAAPGATVTLWEAAYVFRDDMAVAPQFFPQDIVETTADTTGHFTLRRRLDSGFAFKAQADGLFSDTIFVGIVPIPYVEISTSGSSVSVSVVSEPGQGGLPVQIQRLNDGAWTTVQTGATLEGGSYSGVVTGQSGTQSYRVLVGPDTSNRVLVGTSGTYRLTVGSAEPPVVTDPGPTTPTPPTTPTTPTKPTTPTTPGEPKAGDVRFSLVQYNPPGTDTKSKLNQEYVRITNFSSSTVNLRLWTVRDRSGWTYRFRDNYLLGAKRSVYVATGRGTYNNPSAWVYWGRGDWVWNNSGDAAYLRTGSNRLMDTCTWGNGSGKTLC